MGWTKMVFIPEMFTVLYSALIDFVLYNRNAIPMLNRCWIGVRDAGPALIHAAGKSRDRRSYHAWLPQVSHFPRGLFANQ